MRFKLPSLSGSLRLRFDPVDAAGLVHISALRVHASRTGQTLLAIIGQTGWQGLHPRSGLHRLSDTAEYNLLSWDTDPILLLPAVDLGPTEQEITVDVEMRFTPNLEGLSALLVSAAPAEPARTCDQLGAAEAPGEVPHTEIGIQEADLLTASIRIAEQLQSLEQVEEGGRNLAAAEANVTALHTDLLTAEETFHEGPQGRSREMTEIAAKNSAYVQSLLAQNDEIRRLEAVNRLAGEALLELRDQLTAAEHWLGDLRNRALVRLSLAIHREKWPL